MILGCVLIWLATVGPPAHAREQVYMRADDFVASAFPLRSPQAQALWITQELRRELAEQFGWQPGLRVRYWRQGTRTAWILDEIGKDKPITAGILIDSGSIEDVQVLVFRESRGWEIRYPPSRRNSCRRVWLQTVTSAGRSTVSRGRRCRCAP